MGLRVQGWGRGDRKVILAHLGLPGRRGDGLGDRGGE